jgi:hypothetical protein
MTNYDHEHWTDERFREALDVPFHTYDSFESGTIREWFKALLLALWVEGEEFSGKRPLGNSDWQDDPVEELIDEGFIEGADRPGFILVRDPKEYDSLMCNLIRRL